MRKGETGEEEGTRDEEGVEGGFILPFINVGNYYIAGQMRGWSAPASLPKENTEEKRM